MFSSGWDLKTWNVYILTRSNPLFVVYSDITLYAHLTCMMELQRGLLGDLCCKVSMLWSQTEHCCVSQTAAEEQSSPKWCAYGVKSHYPATGRCGNAQRCWFAVKGERQDCTIFTFVYTHLRECGWVNLFGGSIGRWRVKYQAECFSNKSSFCYTSGHRSLDQYEWRYYIFFLIQTVWSDSV